MDDSSIPSQIEQRQSPSFFTKYKFTLITLCIILIALIPLLILSRHSKTTISTEQTATAQPTTTPTPLPLTQQNAQPTLDAVSQNIQSSIDQSNQDLQAVNQVDASQDSVAGL